MFGVGLWDAEQHHAEFSELHGAGSSAESGDSDDQGDERGRWEQIQLSKHHGHIWERHGVGNPSPGGGDCLSAPAVSSYCHRRPQ